MAFSPAAVLLRRSSSPLTPLPLLLISLVKAAPFSASARSLSTDPLPLPLPPDSPKPSLSSRLSFVFDQIDAIDRDRAAKDAALQRIRAWHHTKPPPPTPPPPAHDAKPAATAFHDRSPAEVPGVAAADGTEDESIRDVLRKEVELVHPWPEWIELMERLAQQNYFDFRRTDEDRVAENLSIDLSAIKEEVGFDFSGDWTTVRNACMNFGRDRFDILRSLSRKDLQILVGHGCPSMDPKIVFSAKLLRKLVHLDEGDVCSSCSLRNSCGRGYILTRKEDEARTLDVMRILLTFGFDHVKETVENKPIIKMKSVKTVVRKLLHEIVKLSAVPIDPNLAPPVIKKPPPKVKQPPPPPKKRVGRNDVEMKKGDWLCTKCDFMNFAKNTVCLQCDAKRPKRQLLPGEWECPQCNFLNYRRNMACFHCDRKRPPDEYTENEMQTNQSGPRTRLERTTRMPDVSTAWNFDFDDNESDGADVAAFEFADSRKGEEGSSLDNRSHRGTGMEFEDDTRHTGRVPRTPERGQYFKEADERKCTSHSRGTGFDDFDDEEDDDDVDNYELDSTRASEVSRKNFSEMEKTSDSEGFVEFDNYINSNQGSKDCKSDCEDDVRADHPYWRPSHAVDSRQKAGGRGHPHPLRDMPFGSDDDYELGSDSNVIDGSFRSRRGKGHQDNLRKARRGRISDSDDGFLDMESDDDNLHARGNGSFRSRQGKGHQDNLHRARRGRLSDSDGDFLDMESDDDNFRVRGNEKRRKSICGGSQREFGAADRMSDKRDSFVNGHDGSSSRGLRARGRGPAAGRRNFRENDGFQHFDRFGNKEGFGSRQRGRTNQFHDRTRGSQREFGAADRMSGKRNSFVNGHDGSSSRGLRARGRGPVAGRRNFRENDGFQHFDRFGNKEGFGSRQRGRTNQFHDRTRGSRRNGRGMEWQ